ncbi:uncharacterized protein LOC115970443 [Quercus lobata]|uniref:uncharacterized protein LOC115970443 n=1 Tax=Quercus lobata TaxID=97700 RepID=UPI001245A699|nr:uncharacterized protein LOC115970443 [Quercus lobata]
MSNLAHQHISTSDLCEQCKAALEDTIHALWVQEDYRKELFIMVVWAVWNRRNSLKFGHPTVAVDCINFKAEYPFFKENFDAVVFKTSSSTSISVIIQDGMGEAIGALTMPIPLANSVATMEALACRRAVLFAKEIGLSDMIFEGDSTEVIQAIIQENLDHPHFGHIIDDITILALDLNSFQFCHVKCNCNVVADALAKRAKNSSSLDVWLEDVPDDIVHLLSFDVP